MAIALKLATIDTPEPWQAAMPGAMTDAMTDATAFAPPSYAAPLEYAREGLPSAPPRTLGRIAWAMLKRLLSAFGWTFGAALLVLAFALLAAATVIRLVFGLGAAFLLLLRRLSPFRLFAYLRFGGRVPEAQLA